MSNIEPTFANVVERYGPGGDGLGGTVRYANEAALTAGLAPAEIIRTLHTATAMLQHPAAGANGWRQAEAHIRQHWGGRSTLATFAASQLHPQVITQTEDQEFAAVRQQANQLVLARTAIASLRPAKGQRVKNLGQTLPAGKDYMVIHGLLQHGLFESDTPAALEQYRRVARGWGVTDRKLSEIALSELSPELVANPTGKSPYVIKRHADILRYSRKLAALFHAADVRAGRATPGQRPLVDK